MSFGSFVLLPNITGDFSLSEMLPVETTHGAFYTLSDTPTANTCRVQGPGSNYIFGFHAYLSNSIYNRSDTVQPASLVFNYMIKY